MRRVDNYLNRNDNSLSRTGFSFVHRALKLSVQHSLDDVDNDFWMRNGFELERSCVGHGDVGAGNTNYGCVLQKNKNG